jgi:hypothetical protein
MQGISRSAAALLLAVGLTAGAVSAQQADVAQQPVVTVDSEKPDAQGSAANESEQGAREIVEECKADRGEPGEDDRGIGECVSEAVHERNEDRQEDRAAESEEAASHPTQESQASVQESQAPKQESQALADETSADESAATEADQGAKDLVEECKADRGEPGEDDRGIGECVSEAVHERNEERREDRAAEKEERTAEHAGAPNVAAEQVQASQHGRAAHS